MTLNQLQLFCVFLIDGLIIGFIFDIFRIHRKAFKNKNYITYIQDALFWILTGILIIYTTTVYNDGELRFYMIFATMLGVVIYLFTLSKLIISIGVKLILFIKRILLAIIKKVIGPTKFLVINIKKLRKNKQKEGIESKM